MYFDFLKEMYPDIYIFFQEGLDQKLERLVFPFVKNEMTDVITRGKMFMRAFDNLLNREDFDVQKPIPQHNCVHYLNGNCTECKEKVAEYRRYGCPSDNYEEDRSQYAYDSYELIIGEDSVALFLEDASKVIGWPKAKCNDGPHPLLVINEQTFLVMLNEELEKIAYEENTMPLEFKAAEVKELMKDEGILLYAHYASRDRNTFTHGSLDEGEFVSFPAYFIRLNNEQAKVLKEKNELYKPSWYFSRRAYKKIMEKIETQWSRLCFPVKRMEESEKH